MATHHCKLVTALLLCCTFKCSHSYFVIDAAAKSENTIPNNFDRDLGAEDFRNDVAVKNFLHLKDKIDEVPCQIISTPFGCCWDNRTIAEGPDGTGCPACSDVDADRCVARQRLCTMATVRRECPETCNVPCGCKDRFGSSLCKKVKKFGHCRWLRDHCQKTCKACWYVDLGHCIVPLRV